MIRHSNSFIFSIFIHIVVFIGIFLSYKQVMAGLHVEKKAPLLCIKLSSVSPEPVHKQEKKLTKKKVKKTKVKKLKTKRIDCTKEVAVANVIIRDEIVVLKEEPQVEKNLSENNVKIDKKKIEERESKPVKVVKAQIAPEKEYIDENIAKIVALLQENLHYPRRARKRGIQGEVLVRFTLSIEAHITEVKVLSSNSEILSRGAVQTIKNIDKKLPKPKQNITFNVPIAYTLN